MGVREAPRNGWIEIVGNVCWLHQSVVRRENVIRPAQIGRRDATPTEDNNQMHREVLIFLGSNYMIEKLFFYPLLLFKEFR